MYLGVKAVLVKSFARIHLANLINFGIAPLTFKDENDYEKINPNDEIEIDFSGIEENKVTLNNKSNNVVIPVVHSLEKRDIEILKAGGALNHAKQKAEALVR